MKAVLVKENGGSENLYLGEFKTPEPNENEILVKVEASALNRADILQREGKYPPPKNASPIIGLEIAGTISKVGKSVKKWKEGDKVFGLIPGGGYAQFAVINEDMAMRIPDNLSFEEAAAIPEVFLTAFQALVWYGKLKKDDYVLIHAGGSGVGTAAIQIAKEIGAHIIITASKSKHKTCSELGADKTIDYKPVSFDKEVLEYTNQKGVDVIIDFIAGPYLNQNIDCLKTDGRLVLLATLGGGKVKEFDLRKVLTKRLSIIGSTLRARDINYQKQLTKDFGDFALPKFASGNFKPVIDSVYDWKNVAKAHDYMEANKNTGKIVLKIE